MEILLPQIIYQIVNFLVIFILLTYLLYKPILKIFKERTERIEEGQKAALKAIEEKDSIAKLKTDTQKKLEAEESKKMEAITEDVKKKKQEMLGLAELEIKKFVAEQEEKWREEKAQRIANMRESLLDAVVMTSEKVIAKKLTQSDKQKLVDTQLDQVLTQI